MLRDTLVDLIEPMLTSAGADPLALYIHTRTPASDDSLPCLKNPRPEGAESSLTESASSPFQAEPAQHPLDGLLPRCGETLGSRPYRSSRRGQLGRPAFHCSQTVCLYRFVSHCDSRWKPTAFGEARSFHRQSRARRTVLPSNPEQKRRRLLHCGGCSAGPLFGANLYSARLYVRESASRTL